MGRAARAARRPSRAPAKAQSHPGDGEPTTHGDAPAYLPGVPAGAAWFLASVTNANPEEQGKDPSSRRVVVAKDGGLLVTSTLRNVITFLPRAGDTLRHGPGLAEVSGESGDQPQLRYNFAVQVAVQVGPGGEVTMLESSLGNLPKGCGRRSTTPRTRLGQTREPRAHTGSGALVAGLRPRKPS